MAPTLESVLCVTNISSADRLSTNELFEKLKTYIDTKFKEQKSEIITLIHPIENNCRVAVDSIRQDRPSDNLNI